MYKKTNYVQFATDQSTLRLVSKGMKLSLRVKILFNAFNLIHLPKTIKINRFTLKHVEYVKMHATYETNANS